LVEGGGGLAAALLRADLVDEVHWMLAPKLIGSDGKPGLGPLGFSRLLDTVELDAMRTRRLGPDLHVQGEVRRGPARKKGTKR
jgi:diaminohydroxyphosphoribosylaminopyrimidine deaminase/5-amino-6-(5-phosphoribosylamino)uracil reductase